jgi:putative membrane protein
MMIFEYLKPAALLGSLVYSLLGIVFVVITFIVIDRLTPGNLWKELIEERNQAIATVVAAMILAIAIIVASAMH